MSARPLPPRSRRQPGARLGPAASAWVSANAGTGKTEVLVRRSLRLLLAGSRPESHPVPHLHQDGGGGDAEPPARPPVALGHDFARQVGLKTSRRCCGVRPTRAKHADRAAPVRPRARGQRRPQDPHHPRLLRAAAAALSARIASDAAFLGARRARAGAAAPRRLRRRGVARRRGQRQRARQGAGRA